jgi:lysophospholipase L1-like esterase
MRFAGGLGPEHLAADGFHPGPAIYRAWAAAAHDALLGTAAAPGRSEGGPR